MLVENWVDYECIQNKRKIEILIRWNEMTFWAKTRLDERPQEKMDVSSKNDFWVGASLTEHVEDGAKTSSS